MKRSKLIMAALGLGALIAVKQPSFAQDAAAPPAADNTTTPAPRARHSRMNPLDRLTTLLALTDDQKTKIQPIIEDRATQMRALRKDTSLTPDQRRDKAKTIEDSANQQINAVLTPDQQTKYADWLAKRSAKRHEAAPAANPAP